MRPEFIKTCANDTTAIIRCFCVSRFTLMTKTFPKNISSESLRHLARRGGLTIEMHSSRIFQPLTVTEVDWELLNNACSSNKVKQFISNRCSQWKSRNHMAISCSKPRTAKRFLLGCYCNKLLTWEMKLLIYVLNKVGIILLLSVLYIAVIQAQSWSTMQQQTG